MRTFTLVALWLLNPLLWNAALFEFHALAFAPLFLLSAAYAYVRRRFGWFLLWILLSLSVREDIALIAAMFGAISAYNWFSERVTRSGGPPPRAALEHGGGAQRQDPRAAWWFAVPLLLGFAWFFIAMRIAAANSANGAYKFLIYYGWLRDALGHPLTLLQHLVSLGNIDMVLGLLLPFLFLPLLRPRWLLLAIPPFLQILLAAPGGSNVVVGTHYALLFLPAFVLASIDALRTFSPPSDGRGSERGWGQSFWFQWLTRRFPLPRTFAIPLGVATVLAAAWALGPFPGIARVVIHGASAEDRARRTAYDQLLARVPPDAAVAVGYAALPHVAARENAYALAYLYLGVTQYGLKPYVSSAPLQYLVMDQRDAVTYAAQFPTTGWSVPYAERGPENLRALITALRAGVVGERNGVALLQRGVGGPALPDRYIRATASSGARLTVDDIRDVTVSTR